jgi:protein-disulfide isomerase
MQFLVAFALVIAMFATPATAADPVDRVLGQADAPVRVVEYFSFSCPHCERFHRELFPWLKRDYIDSGKVVFEARDFPLNYAALLAAKAAHCGGDERYFELVDVVWANWDDWIGEKDVKPPLQRLLVDNGIAADTAAGCLGDGGQVELDILESMKAAIDEVDIDGTPTFLINGRKVAGLPAKANLKAVLDEALAAAQ